MCTIAAGLLVASVVSSYVGQQQAAKAQERSVREQADVQQAALAAQQQEIIDASVSEETAASREQKIVQARLLSSRQQGLSLQHALSVQQVLGGEEVAGIRDSLQKRVRQNKLETKAVRASAKNKIASIERPNPLGAALQIASITNTAMQSKGS